jgi:hypothetical protein
MAETTPKANIQEWRSHPELAEALSLSKGQPRDLLSHKPGRPCVSAGLLLTTTRYLLFVPVRAISVANITLASKELALTPC